jgi:hypothetical protein
MRHKMSLVAAVGAMLAMAAPKSRKATDDLAYTYEPIKRLKPRDKLKGKPWSRKKAKKSKKGFK